MGVSGVALSQYIKMVAYAKNNYAPDSFVIVIVGNDFDEALCNYRIKLGTWCFDENFELILNHSMVTQVSKICEKICFCTYLFLQAGFNWRTLMSSFRIKPQGMEAAPEYAGNVKRIKSEERVEKSFIVVDRFFEELNKLQIIDKVTLVLDADRQDIYNNHRTRKLLSENA